MIERQQRLTDDELVQLIERKITLWDVGISSWSPPAFGQALIDVMNAFIVFHGGRK